MILFLSPKNHPSHSKLQAFDAFPCSTIFSSFHFYCANFLNDGKQILAAPLSPSKWEAFPLFSSSENSLSTKYPQFSEFFFRNVCKKNSFALWRYLKTNSLYWHFRFKLKFNNKLKRFRLYLQTGYCSGKAESESSVL